MLQNRAKRDVPITSYCGFELRAFHGNFARKVVLGGELALGGRQGNGERARFTQNWGTGIATT